nr:hypothetical protein [bacterium]
YKVTRDGNTHTLFEAETFEAVCNEWIRLDQGMKTHSGNFYGIYNTERQDIDMEDGLTDEEREQLPPGL